MAERTSATLRLDIRLPSRFSSRSHGGMVLKLLSSDWLGPVVDWNLNRFHHPRPDYCLVQYD